MTPVRGSPFTLETPVDDPRRLEDFFELVPATHLLKGLFIAPVVERLGASEYEAVRPTLVAPPRAGYLAFRDYPQSDHERLLVRLVAKEYPRLSQAEGLRQLARDDMKTLGSSTFGRVVMAMVGDPKGALLRFPQVYAKIAPGPVVSARVVADHVELDFDEIYGVFAYQLGQLEGVVSHYGARPRIEVLEAPEARRARFIVHFD